MQKLYCGSKPLDENAGVQVKTLKANPAIKKRLFFLSFQFGQKLKRMKTLARKKQLALERKCTYFQQTTKANTLLRMPEKAILMLASCCSRAISWMRCCSTVHQQFISARHTVCVEISALLYSQTTDFHIPSYCVPRAVTEGGHANSFLCTVSSDETATLFGDGFPHLLVPEWVIR